MSFKVKTPRSEISLEQENKLLREENAILKAAQSSTTAARLPRPAESKSVFDFMPDGGATGALFRSIDWANHPLGPPLEWPASLKHTLGIIFGSRHPMFLWWGPELFQFYNDAYLPSFGKGKHPTAMGQRGQECWPEIWPVIWPQIEDVFSKGKASWNEDQLIPIFRNGKLEDVYWTYGYSPVRGDDGKIGGALVVCTETTSRVLATQNLERSKQDLQDFFMQAPVPMVILEGPDHLVTLANPPYVRFVGREVAGRTIANAFPKGEADSFIPLLDGVFKTGVPFIGKELPLRLPDETGAIQDLWIDIGYHPFRDSSGAIKGVFALVHDVTHQVLARKAVELSEAKLALERNLLETVFQKSPAAMVLWKGADLVFDKINPGYQAIFTNRKLLGKPFTEALPETKGQPFEQWIKHVFKTGESRVQPEMIAKLVLYDGGPVEDRYFDMSFVRVTDAEDQPYGVYEHAVDVTERVLSRRAIEAGKAELEASVKSLEQEREIRERFVATLTHDLRTPLTAAKISAQLIHRKVIENETVQKLAIKITDNMDRADEMIRDLLDASLLQAGAELPIEIEAFNLSEIAHDTLANLSTVHGDRFLLQCPPKVEGFWSRTALRRVFENLCNNAVKYGTNLKPITVAISEDDSTVQISVHNEGIPIAAEDLAILFKPFARTESAQTGGQKGWGLGLTLVKGIAEAHRGSVSVRSNAEVGTTFSVTLPRDSRKKCLMVEHDD